MERDRFETILDEVYHLEVLGEAFFSTLLKRFTTPDQQYKLGSLLQLETELKARVRPIALAHGVDLVEQEESRQRGRDLAESMDGETWEEVMASFAELIKPFVARYHEMGASVPDRHRELGDALGVHEKSIGDFAIMEAAGEVDKSIADVVAQLIYPMPEPK